MPIDPSAKIAANVELAPDVAVGPGVIIDGPSRIGAGTRILAHAYIGPYTTMGAKQRRRLRGHHRLRPPGLRLHRARRATPSSAITTSSGSTSPSTGAPSRGAPPGWGTTIFSWP